jgi:hypothetical protein
LFSSAPVRRDFLNMSLSQKETDEDDLWTKFFEHKNNPEKRRIELVKRKLGEATV